jgi:hypothetical protein
MRISSLRRLRALRFRHLLAVAFALSTGLVLAAIPGRLDGQRTATDAWIPLRAATPAEAALLFRYAAGAGVVRIDDRKVWLATRFYLVPVERADRSHGEWLESVEVDGRRYEIASASWEATCLLYRLDRAGFERELGRPVGEVDLDPGYLREFRVTFRPELVPLYAVIEILALTVWGAGLAFALLRNRRVTLVLPIWCAAWTLLGLFVAVYSPALGDADWFHQRILVEDLLLSDLGLPSFGLVGDAALVSGFLYVVLRWAEGIAEMRGRPAASHRYAALVLVATLTLAFLAWQLRGFRKESVACDLVLDRALGRAEATGFGWLDGVEVSSPSREATGDLLKKGAMPLEGEAAIESLLGGVPDAFHEIRVLVTTERPDLLAQNYLFLWARNGSEPYADFRTLADGGPAYLTDEAEVLEVLGSARRLRTGFLRYLEGRHLCGERRVDGGRRAAIVVNEDRLASRVPLFLSPF